MVKQLRGQAAPCTVQDALRSNEVLEWSRKKPATKVVNEGGQQAHSLFLRGSREHKVLRGTAVRLRAYIFVLLLLLWFVVCCLTPFDQLHNFRALGLTQITRFPFIIKNKTKVREVSLSKLTYVSPHLRLYLLTRFYFYTSL